MNKKFSSRKFIVWVTATLIMIACCIISFITEDSEVITSFTGIWGGISMLYIGGNVAQKAMLKNEDTNE